MLNKQQYKELVKLLHSISDELDDYINKAKEDFNNNENKEPLQRGIMLGKVSTLALIKNLLESNASSLYKLESSGVDVGILDQVKVALNISTILSQKYLEIEPNIPTETSELLKDQLYLLDLVLNKIKLLLKQSGTIID